MSHVLDGPKAVGSLENAGLALINPRENPLSLADFPLNLPLKWSWSCRQLEPHLRYAILPEGEQPPRAGDVALVQIGKLGYHSKITVRDESRLRLYPCDGLVGVFGQRYATDAYEGAVESCENLHLLTGGGMLGTVKSKHRSMKNPTPVMFLGYLGDEQGQRLNLKQRLFRPAPLDVEPANLILVIGTGMNSGKTTTSAKLIKSLLAAGRRVSACKLTGSVSPNDLHEMRATGAHDARDFSDYGFPSTSMCDQEELIALFETMLADAQRARPDVIIMEVADGLLQRETQMLLRHDAVRRRVRGVLHTAQCAASALFGLAQIEQCGHQVVAISGMITSSPLFVRELAAHSSVPICSSVDDGAALAQRVAQYCGMPT